MRLFSSNLEMVALRSITSGDERVASWLLPRINEDHMSYEPTHEAYRRVLALVRKNGQVPNWDGLLEDLVISEDAREELANSRSGVIRTKADAKKLIARLDEYRRARVWMKVSRSIARTLKDDRVDLDAMGDTITDLVSRARGSSDVTECMTHIGDKETDRKIVAGILRGSKDEFIPTGIRAFDTENQGVPRGSCWVIAATTGGGKCCEYATPVVTSEGIVPIGKVWDDSSSPVDEEGFKQLAEPLFVQTHTGARKRVVAAYKTRGKPMRVTFSNGIAIKGLPEHKLWILNAAGVSEFKRLDQILPGDQAVVHDVDAALARLRDK